MKPPRRQDAKVAQRKTKQMKIKILSQVFVISLFVSFLFADEALKKSAVESIAKRTNEMTSMSDQIWAFAETALKETKSSKLLADYAEQNGFRVTRGVAQMPTAFIAEYGEGHPIIAILGEYDALPGISQKATPQKEPLQEGAAGHGCGHNLFGVASLGSALAIKDLIQAGKLKGTIRFYGTPAEESVGGKAYMIRAGLFKDVDIALAWHPDSETKADTDSSQAMADFKVEFFGKTSHAAFDPWNGRSAVDGLEIFTHAMNLMREHVRPSVRIHYAIQKGGDVPNVVPEYAKLWCWVRDSKKVRVDDLLERVKKVAEGAAMAAGVDYKFTVQAGSPEILVNMPGARLLDANLQWLGPLKFTEEEHAFARQIQKAAGGKEIGLDDKITPVAKMPGEPEGGSTDVADVSWNVPTLHLCVATAPSETPWHAWPVVAAGGMSIGHKGMMYASKAMAATMIDLYLSPQQRDAIKKDFVERKGNVVYKAYIPDGPPPIPAE
jgi:aminobenzoyl-glutamate utilization protein B